MSSSDSVAWWRSAHVVVMVLLVAAVGPSVALLRGALWNDEARAQREHDRNMERRRAGEVMQQRYLDRAASTEERQRVLRLLAANAYTDDLRDWAKAETALLTAEVDHDKRLHAQRDMLQMEAFNLAAKALAKEPAALAEHYRLMANAIGEGRFAGSGTIQSISGETAQQPRLSDLIHKLIDEKQVCLDSGKDEIACNDEVGVAAAPTPADFAAMRALEDKHHDPDAQQRLSELRKRFLKQ